MMNAEELLKFISQFEQEKYQTIELNNKIIRPGSQECWKSWDSINKFNIDWKDKFVCDIGCYFGYFSTKILRAGAKSIFGIDQDKLVLPVYREVLLANNLTNFKTLLLKLGGGNIVPNNNYDILIAMNMLHHVQNSTTTVEYVKVLNSIFVSTKEVFFEINNSQLSQIKDIATKNDFTLINTARSHRVAGTRTILYFGKNNV